MLAHWRSTRLNTYTEMTSATAHPGRTSNLHIQRYGVHLSLRPRTETKRITFGLSPEFRLTIKILRLTNHCSASSLTSSLTSSVTHRWFRRISLFIFDFELAKNEVIFAHQNFSSIRLTYLVHANSTGELISFGFSDRSVRSLHSANRWAIRYIARRLADQTKKTTSLFGWYLVSVRI